MISGDDRVVGGRSEVRLNRRGFVGSAAASAVILAALPGCTVRDRIVPPAVPQPLAPWATVVSSSAIVADVVRAVGGSRIAIRTIMPPGADPHRFRAGAAEVGIFRDTTIAFRLGLGLEPYLDPLIESASEQFGVPLVTITDTIPNEILLIDPDRDEPDPHIWGDPTLWIWVVARVTQALIGLDVSDARRRTFETNSLLYLQRLGELDRYIERQAMRIPVERRHLATAHDAFGYFGQRYGFETRGLLGVSTDSDATAAQVAELAAWIADRQVAAVFPEVSVPLAGVNALRLSGVDGVLVMPAGDRLHSDSLAIERVPGRRYLGMMRANVDAMVRTLAAPR